MPKTIRELADELGVSKQAIWQRIKRDTSIDLRQFTSTKGNTVYVDVDGQKAIKTRPDAAPDALPIRAGAASALSQLKPNISPPVVNREVLKKALLLLFTVDIFLLLCWLI